jgi:hypothetical protein
MSVTAGIQIIWYCLQLMISFYFIEFKFSDAVTGNWFLIFQVLVWVILMKIQTEKF